MRYPDKSEIIAAMQSRTWVTVPAIMERWADRYSPGDMPYLADWTRLQLNRMKRRGEAERIGTTAHNASMWRLI